LAIQQAQLEFRQLIQVLEEPPPGESNAQDKETINVDEDEPIQGCHYRTEAIELDET